MHGFIHFRHVILFCIALALPAYSLTSKPSDGLQLSLALGIGNHRPDLEDKLFNDRFFGAVFVGGFGFNTDWENKDFVNLLPHIRYNRGRWSFELDLADIKSKPSYLGYTAASSLTVLDQVDYQGVLRKRRSLLAGYALNPKAKKHFFRVLGGLGRISVESEATVARAVTIGISASALGVSAGNGTEGKGSGLLAGMSYRYLIDDKWEFNARWILGTLSGEWSSREAFAFTFPSVGFRLEDGDYSIRTSRLVLGADYAYTDRLTFFASLDFESAIHGDSNVVLVTDTIQSDPTTYTRDALLTLGGSSQSESVTTLRLGARYRLEL